METSWNLCAPTLQPIILSKNPNPISHEDQMVMTPSMLDTLNSSPNSIDNEKQFMIPQRRMSASYETSYLNGQHHQYSVQGSTSTPNSVGPSSGTASPDNTTQLTSDSLNFTNCVDPNVKWIDRPLNAVDGYPPPNKSSPRYCYVFQQPDGSISTMSDSASIISNSSVHSTITVPTSSLMSQSTMFTASQPVQTVVTVSSPFPTNSSPTPPNATLVERSSSVPLQNASTLGKQEVANKVTDFSALSNPNAEAKSKKLKKRKALVEDLNQPAKKSTTNKDVYNRSTAKPTISALTRRRLKTAEKSGEPLEKMHLLLTELTVEDLKIICRKYNLAISGTKSDLLRRLNPIEAKIDVEAILLKAMQEEDLCQTAEKPPLKDSDAKTDANKSFVTAKPISTVNTVPTVKIPVTCTTSCNGGNQFDMAISNYLLQQRKQFTQQQGHATILKTSAECTESGCSCLHQPPPLPSKASFPAAKAIYFAPSTTVVNGAGSKTTVIRVPIASFNPGLETTSTTASSILSKKLCKLDNSQCNGPATFSYAEMGSGGQFTLEASPIKTADPASSNIPKFVQISVPSTFCTNIKEPLCVGPACAKCKEKKSSDESGNEELQLLVNELSLGQSANAIENSTLTARILGLHQQMIKAQYSRLYEMGKLIGDSQKMLQCQKSKIDAARKAMAKIKANKPSSIDTIMQKLNIAQLNAEHTQQSNELKTIQQNHQHLKTDQERLTKSVMEVQEEIHIDQAVEDVVRLIKTNRKTALLIVQLVHKFQCDRMHELNRFATKKQENKASNCAECTNEPNQKCNCLQSNGQQTSTDDLAPAVVTIDESDDELAQQKFEEGAVEGNLTENDDTATLSKSKKKSKSLSKRVNKSAANRSEHTFAEVMEDIFLTVISNDNSTNDSTKENVLNRGDHMTKSLLVGVDSKDKSDEGKSKDERRKFKKILKTSTMNSPSLTNSQPNELSFIKSPNEGYDEVKKVEKQELSPYLSNDLNLCEASLTCKVSLNQSVFNNNTLDPSSNELVEQPTKVYDASAEQTFTNLTNDQFQTPTLCNYMTSTTATKSEINSAYSANNSYTPSLNYSETRPNNTAYHQRRAFLQQKRQTLYEQLEQIERQQLHNEMQNSYICNSIDIDEELANLGDLNVEELYNYDFDQLDVPTPTNETSLTVPYSTCPQPPSYVPLYHSQTNSGYLPAEPLVQTQQQQAQQRCYSTRTFQANSTDFEDILDLIRDGEKNRQLSTDFDGAQATQAIYQELRLTDIDELNWTDSMPIDESNKQMAVTES